MRLAVIAEVWQMVKESIIPTDRDTVAENLVTILIDNDISPSEIKTTFRDDYDITSALKYHVDYAQEDDEEEEEEYDDGDGDDFDYEEDEEEW